MTSTVNNIESNLLALEKNTSITAASKKCIIYSTIAAIISIFLFRPIYIYRKDITLNKNRKPIQEKYILSYYRCVGCLLAYVALFFLFFKYYLNL
jgi:hypothetical protein